MNIEKTLKGLQDSWDEAETMEMTGGFTKYKDGEYQVKLINGTVGLSKASSRPQVTWEMKFITGEYEGKTVMKFDGIEDAQNLSWIKGVMNLIGIDIPKKLSQLPAALEEFFSEHKKGVLINISLVTKNEFQNIYINGLADEAKTKDADDDNEPAKKKKSSDDADLEDMTFKQLKAYIKENDVDVDPTDFDESEALVKAIRKSQAKSSKKKSSRFEE